MTAPWMSCPVTTDDGASDSVLLTPNPNEKNASLRQLRSKLGLSLARCFGLLDDDQLWVYMHSSYSLRTEVDAVDK